MYMVSDCGIIIFSTYNFAQKQLCELFSSNDQASTLSAHIYIQHICMCYKVALSSVGAGLPVG